MHPLPYHIVWTTYGAWLPGDARGWVRKGRWTVQSPDPVLVRQARERMAEAPVLLTPAQRSVVERTAADHCRLRSWNLHAVRARANHVHVVVTADRVPNDRCKRAPLLRGPLLHLFSSVSSERFLTTNRDLRREIGPRSGFSKDHVRVTAGFLSWIACRPVIALHRGRRMHIFLVSSCRYLLTALPPARVRHALSETVAEPHLSCCGRACGINRCLNDRPVIRRRGKQ